MTSAMLKGLPAQKSSDNVPVAFMAEGGGGGGMCRQQTMFPSESTRSEKKGAEAADSDALDLCVSLVFFFFFFIP